MAFLPSAIAPGATRDFGRRLASRGVAIPLSVTTRRPAGTRSIARVLPQVLLQAAAFRQRDLPVKRGEVVVLG